tara:strand:- start:2525 stop:2689 length:165 start_codon:yes stop_codon:yes gene_type:complete
VFYGPVVQLDRISDFGSEGWRFESFLGHLKYNIFSIEQYLIKILVIIEYEKYYC